MVTLLGERIPSRIGASILTTLGLRELIATTPEEYVALAIHHARGEIRAGERLTIESILGTTFTGRVVGETPFGPHAAVVPEVEGSAFITGRHEFLIDPDDPLREGFILR